MIPPLKPHLHAKTAPKEFSFKAVVLGALLSVFFAVGNAYLGLKIGTTVSASIPAAVFSLGLFRAFRVKATLLEHNMVQTIASVGEALAAGAIFTLPALFLIGAPPSLSRIFLLCLLGGILGVLFMIPMRRYIIVQKHKMLPFPEGTACAKILQSGEEKKTKAFVTLISGILGASYKALTSIFQLWTELPTWTLSFWQNTVISLDSTPALLGVGYLVGPRTCYVLFSGGAFGWLVLIPLISFFGEGARALYPATMPISAMSADAIWSNYIRYIGLGAVAAGGLMSFGRVLPIVKKTLHVGFKELFQGYKGSQDKPLTDLDISLKWLILGSTAIILTLWLVPSLPMNFLTIVLLVILSFFFVAVTSLTVGIIGSTSNPVSGMTITTLLLTCLIFLSLGWTERVYMISALTMGCVACTAICLASTTSQDLKTGYLLGATPMRQQIGEIIGMILPALALGSCLYILDRAYGFGSRQLPAPQGTMLAMIAQGVMQGHMPVTLVGAGAVIAALLSLLKVPILPFAMGLYLPFSLSSAMLIGGLVHAGINHWTQRETLQTRGILAASGFVAGDAVVGVIAAFLTVVGVLRPGESSVLPQGFSLLGYGALALALTWMIVRKSEKQSSK